jgi:bifunctional DNase/RNase
VLVPADVWTVAKAPEGNAVLVRPAGSDAVVPIFVDQSIAHSILIGMGEFSVPRPLTHDLFLQTLEQLQANVNRIEITEINDNVFYARLILLQHNDEEVVIDARPSDCIALAVRVKCPIFIDEDVVSAAGMPVSSVTPSDAIEEIEVADETTVAGRERGQAGGVGRREVSLLSQLKDDLDVAVQDENYEEAAKLRDQIQKLEGPA